jgi:single-stranded-DNA-specific exonuclease
MENNPEVAAQKAMDLEEVNRRRQDQTLRIVSEAKEQALTFQDRKIIVVAGEGWNKGIVGLVAGRLAEEFYKPVIVLEKTTEFSTGSARTVGDFNILEALKHASEHLVRFGGHKQAAGLTLQTVKLEIFYQKVLDYAEANIVESSRTLELEAELQASDLVSTTYNLVSSLEPFGVNNPKPKFLISALEILDLKPVGKTGQHFQL